MRSRNRLHIPNDPVNEQLRRLAEHPIYVFNPTTLCGINVTFGIFAFVYVFWGMCDFRYMYL